MARRRAAAARLAPVRAPLSAPAVRVAPLIDALCIVALVAFGRDHHDIDEGIGWWLTILWPLLLGWFAAAVATRLYTRNAGRWLALLATLVAGILVGSFFRGAFTDRPYLGIFTIVSAGFLTLTTVGWRAVAALIVGRRPAT
jgi:hypothetical protein